MNAQRAVAEAAMRQHIAEAATFTFHELYRAGDRAVGEQVSYRWADALLQKERKAGHIRQTARRGIWEKVPS